MSEEHAPAAIALQLKSIKSITLLILSLHKVDDNNPKKWRIVRPAHLEQSEVGLPLVANDLAAGETPDGNDHLSQPLKAIKHSDLVLYMYVENIYQGIGYKVSPSLYYGFDLSEH